MKPSSWSRRDFLGESAAALAGTLLSGCGSAAGSPNILWITCEDISPHLGCYGDEYAYTPNLDRLAAEGVRYTNAFATAPVCTPARSCLITGAYANSLGTQNLRGPMPKPDAIPCYTEYLREAGYFCTNNVKEDYNFETPAAAWDESSKDAHWRKGPEGVPFFSIFNLTMTHQSKTRYPLEELEKISATLPPEARHDPARAPLPPYYPDTPIVRANVAAFHTQVTLMDQRAGEIFRELADDGLADDTVVFFYSDHGSGLPRHKRWLHDSGIHVPLIIRFPEKHRHLAPASPGSVEKRLVSFVDFPPTMLSLTGLPIPDYMQGSAFLGAKTRPPKEYVYASRDRVDEVIEISRTVRDERYHYIRNFTPHRPTMQRSNYSEHTPIRKEVRRLARERKLSGDAAWLARETKPAEELYDTQTDPHEMNNLAAMEEHQETLERMRGKLREWMLEIRDVGLLPEPELAQRSNGGSPYEMARQPKAYPLERVLEVADLVGRGAEKLPALKEALSDDDLAVRYWGAVGLLALGEEARSAVPELKGLLTDEASLVRIPAAEALCHLGEENAGAPVLAELLGNKDARLALQAASALCYVGKKAAPARAVFDRKDGVAYKPESYVRYIGSCVQEIRENLEL